MTVERDRDVTKRMNWFDRQFLRAQDLADEQDFHRDRRARHNRLLHGWGIVCGVRVSVVGKTVVRVTPGYVLGPYGDEILVPDEVTLDVTQQSSVAGIDCAPVDPWCAEPPRLREDQPAYLAVRHVERDTRPVRVPACGCACDDAACEYSRVRDGFELAVLAELPEAYRTNERPSLDAVTSCANGPRDPCPACPADPWVILADVTVSAGAVHVEPEPHRRYVASYAGYWYGCAAG